MTISIFSCITVNRVWVAIVLAGTRSAPTTPTRGGRAPDFIFQNGLSASGSSVVAFDGFATVTEYVGGPFSSGSACPWATLDFNYYEIASATVGGAGIFEIHYGGSMWSYTGTPCTDNNYDLICPGWVQLD